jgi:hypothetical protein
MELPTITDGFTGQAPDLGAYESGQPMPHYGPIDWPLGAPEKPTRAASGPPRP